MGYCMSSYFSLSPSFSELLFSTGILNCSSRGRKACHQTPWVSQCFMQKYCKLDGGFSVGSCIILCYQLKLGNHFD